MAIEIERKFLVKDDSWKALAINEGEYKQGYITTQKVLTPRIRIVGNQGYLTIKGSRVGWSRFEFEYTIPLDDAKEIIDNYCDRPFIEKMRYKFLWKNLVWEIDEFFGKNKGLILAEVELEDENQNIELPPWVGKEVSDDPKYLNYNLVRHPYILWKK